MKEKEEKPKVVALASRRAGSVEHMASQVEELLADVKAGSVSVLLIAGIVHHKDKHEGEPCSGHFNVGVLALSTEDNWTAAESAQALGLATYAQQAIALDHGFMDNTLRRALGVEEED